MTGYELGEMGERFIALLLYRAGLNVERGGPADLLADGVPVEVKAARPSRQGRGRRDCFQFCLRRTNGNGAAKTDHRKADLVVLLCYPRDGDDPLGAFVIPSAALGDRRKLRISACIPWAYRGRWAGYLNAWHVLERVLNEANGD